jgi:hypothetical protein
MRGHANKNTGRTIRRNTQTTVLFLGMVDTKQTVSYNYLYIYCLITIQREVWSLNGLCMWCRQNSLADC